jgi:hypothetical protein
MLAFSVLILALATFCIKDVKAADTEDAYTIDWVNHRVEVIYNGYIVINDTIKVNGATPNSFLAGFPYKYGLSILKCIAYDANNPTNKYQVTLKMPLENRSGFYGVKIDFSQEIPQVFTVVFVLSSDLLTQNAQNLNRYTLDFPAYPSLTKQANICNVSLVLPEGAENVIVKSEDKTVNASSYYKENLPAFTYLPATATFSLADDKMQLVDITAMEREIRIIGLEEIECLDSYYIKSRALEEISFIDIVLPHNASNPTAHDQFGRKIAELELIDETTNRYRVNFTLPLESYNSTTKFTVEYYLPNEVYIKKEGAKNFKFTFALFEHINYYIEQASITFVLPEGAKISSENVSISGSYGITNGVFQETITINKRHVFFLDNFTIEIAYECDPLWVSFRPTLWIWALATVGCAIIAAWKRPKAPVPVTMPTVAVRLSPQLIKSFVDAYEEKKKVILELKSLEVGVRKGRVPRRRYKVQRKILETRLNTLSRNLDDLRGKLQAIGGRYTDLMRQLEVAETEINEVEANIESIETRHRKGDLSLEAYRKLLTDYERRKEKAETTINGILVRLREEIR